VFKVIYNDVGYMYEVVGITGNSTEVVENLQDLNGTVAGYIEYMLVRADNVEAQYSGLQHDLGEYSTAFGTELNTLGAELGTVRAEADQTATDVETLSATLSERELLWQRAMKQVVAEVEDLRTFQALTYGVYVMFIAFSVIVIIMNYVMLRK